MIELTQELKDKAKKEAEKLKQFAPKKALAKLSKEALIEDTLYGILTGYMYGLIAQKLVRKCGEPYSERLCEFKEPIYGFQLPTERSFSALECYVYTKGAKVDNLFSYLKGETETLNL